MNLTCERLVYRYAGLIAVDGLSVDFSDPGLSLVVGPNGSGKSTLLKLLAGLIKPSGGSARLDGREISSLKNRERALLVSWMSQSPASVPKWPASDFVLSGRYPHRGAFEPFTPEDRRKTAEIFGGLSIGHLSDRRLDGLSGGELQLVRIARALVQETPFLFLDEPFGSLDIRHRATVWKALSVRAGLTVVVSHDLSLIGEDLKRLLLLRDGKLVADGSPAEVLTTENIRTAYDWSPPTSWKFTPSDFLR